MSAVVQSYNLNCKRTMVNADSCDLLKIMKHASHHGTVIHVPTIAENIALSTRKYASHRSFDSRYVLSMYVVEVCFTLCTFIYAVIRCK